jgi:hypothetical protein
MMQHFGGTTNVLSSRACVVYNHTTGRIHHIRNVITLEGGREPPEAEIEKDAVDAAERHGADKSQVRTMHLGAEAIKPRTRYTVDLKEKRLVEVKNG